MVYEDLFARLNEVGYKNWLKAGYCLLKVKDGLCGFADKEMQNFHSDIIDNNLLLQSTEICRRGCKPRGNQFEPVCSLCAEWKREIRIHHTKPSAFINWGNCRPWLWSTEPWELAKAFMPRGQTEITRAEQCDAAALLNLFHFCDHFSFINPNLITEVIQHRNKLMHSCEMQVSNQWMTQFQKSLERLLMPLRHIPEVAAAGRQIEEMMSVDLRVHIPGVDSVDGGETGEVLIESVSQWETELLRESLRDLINTWEEDDTMHSVVMEEVQSVSRFLSSHKDLQELFRPELQSIMDLQEKQQKIIKKNNTEER